MRIYGHPHSPDTRMILLTLAEKERTGALVAVELAHSEHERADRFAPHPCGGGPRLEQAGFVLCQASAIMRYLDAALPGPALTPSALRERAQMDQWLGVEASRLSPARWTLVSQLVLGPRYGQKPDLAEVTEARQEVTSTLAMLERALADRPYLAGDFSLAEVAFTPALQVLVDIGEHELVQRSRQVFAWWERLRARPSWRRVLATSPAARRLASLPGKHGTSAPTLLQAST